MSKNILLILPSVLKERSALHTNVDDKLIAPEIKAVQDLSIMPLLGSTLFNKIIADIDGGTLTGNYKILVDDYLIDCICNYVMAELAPSLNAQYWNKGVSTKQADQSQIVNGSDLRNAVDKYRGRAENYAQRTKRFLQQNAQSMFPEYYQLIAGIDVVPPEGAIYECPIWLGGKDVSVKPQPSYNLPIDYTR